MDLILLECRSHMLDQNGTIKFKPPTYIPASSTEMLSIVSRCFSPLPLVPHSGKYSWPTKLKFDLNNNIYKQNNNKQRSDQQSPSPPNSLPITDYNTIQWCFM